MRSVLLTIGLLSTATSAVAGCPADSSACAHEQGEHPAIVARRVIAAQGYDYASKFYLHPAGLYLAASATSDAATLARAAPREQERRVTLESLPQRIARR
jgi:hypothetical protein